MHIILVRHAEAVNIGDDGVAKDFDRFLSSHGSEQAAKLTAALKARKVVPTVVVSSPLVRARQTAEPLLQLLATPIEEPLFCDYLAVGEMKRKKLTKFVEGLHADVVVLVGHNPDLSEYAAWLIGAGGESVSLEKAAAASIRFEGEIGKGRGALEWLVTPVWFMGAERGG